MYTDSSININTQYNSKDTSNNHCFTVKTIKSDAEKLKDMVEHQNDETIIEKDKEMIENEENYSTSEEAIKSDKEEGSSRSVVTKINSDSYDKLAIGVMKIDKDG